MTKTLNRRTFLKVSAAGGALLVGGYVPGLREGGTAEAAAVFERRTLQDQPRRRGALSRCAGPAGGYNGAEGKKQKEQAQSTHCLGREPTSNAPGKTCRPSENVRL